MRTIRVQTPPNLAHRPVVSFDDEAFNSLIWQKGYKVLLEEARQCPCRSRESGSPLSACQNCRGFGFLFINPIETRAIISEIRKEPRYEEWSEESRGTIQATFMNANRLAEYDRVTFLEAVSKRSEALRVRSSGEEGKLFVFLTYYPTKIIDVFYFQSPSSPLVQLSAENYTIDTNPYVLLLDFKPPLNWNYTITVTYNCRPQYHVIDLPKETRVSNRTTRLGRVEDIQLPVHAVLRKAHMVLGIDDFEGGTQMIDNSYK